MPTTRLPRKHVALVLGLVLCGLLASRPAEAETQIDIGDEDVYRLHPAIDTAILLGGSVLWTTAFFIASPELDNEVCNPCDPDDVNAMDRHFIQFHNKTWRLVGDFAYLLPIAAFAVFDATDVGWRRWRTWMTDFFIFVESLLIQGVLTEVVRRSVHRPRPFLYVEGVYPDQRDEIESTFSFYSGHTSAIFALLTGVAYTWTLRHPGSPWNPLVWLGLLIPACIEPIARVGSGDHFPTDAMIGMAVGAAVGLGWTALRHRMYERDRALGLAMGPVTSENGTAGGAQVSLSGTF